MTCTDRGYGKVDALIHTVSTRKSNAAGETMTLCIRIAMGMLYLASQSACAFESDVHYGLTQWLGVEAGFSRAEASTIASGNQRVDSGIMDTIELVLEYACLEQHADAAQVVRSYHFPSMGKVPAAPEKRAVVAGDLSARSEVEKILKVTPGKADASLLKFGETLHLLQDSWAYQGKPDTPRFPGTPIQCDSTLAWTAPATRGGWASHNADLTHQWSPDTTAMAAATYVALTQYPPIAGKSRTAAAWNTLLPKLHGFIVAATKAEKQAWFRAQDISDTTFLEGLSLEDGQGFAGGQWSGRRLLALQGGHSLQYQVDEDLKAFYDIFFQRWIGGTKPESALGTSSGAASQRELAARLRLWRLSDHGAASKFVHSQAVLSQSQLREVDRLASRSNAYVQYKNIDDAFFPLLQQGSGASPLLPFVIHALPVADKKDDACAIAVAKLRHTPYDEIGVIAKKIAGKWRVVEVLSVVSH